MSCSATQDRSGRDSLISLSEKASRLRIPVTGGLDLTHRCNLRCLHCYLSPESRSAASAAGEMDTRLIFRLIDEMTEAGCLYLFITGGEPLLRPDFGEIYRRAKLNGIMVTVFTNATLVTEEIAGLFSELPPYSVEVSVYGATARTYEKITGVAGSFRRCLEGIERLLAGGVRVRLKTVLTILNHGELSSLRRMAEGYGVKFHFDAAIFPRLDGDPSPLGLRVPAGTAAEEELSDRETLRQWADLFRRYSGSSVSGGLYACGAGTTGFHIDARGLLRPCLMTSDIGYDLSSGSFGEGWAGMSRFREGEALYSSPCSGCDKHILCGFCPAFFRLENGSAGVRSEYLCRMGRRRYEIISRLHEEST